MNENKFNDNNLIEDFINGKLSSEGVNSFNERIKLDKEFAQLYNFRINIPEDWRKANEYEKAKQQAAVLIKMVKHKKKIRAYYYYAIAASLTLLIVIPGIFFLNKPNNNSNNIAGNEGQDSIKSYDLTYKTPENKASIFYMDTIILKSPINNLEVKMKDSLFFYWKPPMDSIENLIIESRINNKIVLSKKIKKGLETFTLNPGFLEEGEYYWYIHGLSVKDSFIIVK
jgi:hypothetical protein